MFYQVWIFWKSFSDEPIVYKIDYSIKNIRPWIIVKVPFWKKEILWVILKKSIWINFDENKIKTIYKIIYDKPIFLDYQIDLMSFISSYYFSLFHNSLRLFLPNHTKKLLEKWKFDLVSKNNFEYNINFENNLTRKQKQVYQNILKNNKTLLFWVTWSWKTQIYIELIRYFLKEGKQTLLLVPEIILSSQIWERIKQAFWEDVIVITSNVSEAKKTSYFIDIMLNKAKIIVWTRSSLFYPYSSLWAIIIDEFHDNSFFSDQTPKYDSIEVAKKISELINCKLILWSATPTIKTMYQALNWEYSIEYLLDEYNEKN